METPQCFVCVQCGKVQAGTGSLCNVCYLKTSPASALATQVAGDHYKKLVIQPVEFCQKNKLTYCESAVVKYVCRHREKKGAEDIRKAIHFLELLLELEYPTEKK